MKKRQRVLLAVTAVTSIAALTACGSGGGGGGGNNAGGNADFSAEPTGTLNAWGFENADDVGQARLDYAAEQLADVDIQLEQTAFDAQKFTAATASGRVPDVVQMSSQFVGTYAAKDLILPLDECLAENDVTADHWYDAVIDDVTYDGSIYAVPQFYQPPAILVNTRLLDAAGLTPESIDTSNREGLLAAVQALYKESGGNPSTLGMDPNVPGSAGLWFLGNGGQIMDEDGRPTLDNEANVDALNFLKQLTDAQGGFAKVKSFIDTFDMFGAENQFVKDQVASGVYAQWYPNVLAATQANITINAVPFKDKDGNPFTVASGTAFVIPKGAENPAAACAWALNLTSDEAWMAAGEARATTIEEDPDPNRMNTGLFTGSPSADQAIREQFVVPTGNAGFDQVIATFYEVVGEGKSFGSSAAGQEIQTELQTAVTAALNGEKTPEQALADGQAAALRAYEQTTGQ
ncbi:ABC transporter substrate-binding protein [Naasia sp. SYSU D00948]|uniref:ABC transporter substrate-binding protein n=1 Tax=Naasia sp. SYSU D00948 TaxID=2817379 RepID=UPI001B30D74A|nr:extracellular solute-binding protein [Naasia sp. SYSU D00948]